MNLKPGSRWKSAASEAEMVVVRPPKTSGVLTCGGQPVVPIAEDRPAGVAPLDGTAGVMLVGKRYGDEAAGLEVLCSKSGNGALAFEGRPLVMKDTKKLPSSD